jgi:hypothetical protein
MTWRLNSRKCRTASIRSGKAGGLAGELARGREFKPDAVGVADAHRSGGRPAVHRDLTLLQDAFNRLDVEVPDGDADMIDPARRCGSGSSANGN